MLRVRVEVVPWGRDDQAFVTDEVWVENTGAGTPEFGRYHILDPYGAPEDKDRGWKTPMTLVSATAAHLSEVVGRLGGIERHKEHRTELAWRALKAAQDHRAVLANADVNPESCALK